ncbi:uncharacterized protein LOC144875114 [Branchiostoma floridae x Branchiostoma japonicum]
MVSLWVMVTRMSKVMSPLKMAKAIASVIRGKLCFCKKKKKRLAKKNSKGKASQNTNKSDGTPEKGRKAGSLEKAKNLKAGGLEKAKNLKAGGLDKAKNLKKRFLK